MQIDKNTVITLQYQLRRDNQEGELIEQTSDQDPLVFLFGIRQMLPEFERQLAGKVVGDDFDFIIKSADAYGEQDPEAIGKLPLETFRVNGEMATDMLVVGNVIPLRNPDGDLLYGTVLAVEDTEVELDFNHPMAGIDLHFTGTVTDIRKATPEELDHGHVHGPGGHQH